MEYFRTRIHHFSGENHCSFTPIKWFLLIYYLLYRWQINETLELSEAPKLKPMYTMHETIDMQSTNFDVAASNDGLIPYESEFRKVFVCSIPFHWLSASVLGRARETYELK